MADDASSLLSRAPDDVAAKRFTWPEVVAMVEAGVFAAGERVELLGGEVFVMPPEGPRHADLVQHIARWLHRNLPDTLEVYVRAPVILPDGVVVPDISVFSAGTRAGDMLAAKASLIVEVGDSTLRYDLTRKEPRYREAGVAEVWFIAAETASLWVRRDPADAGWRFQKEFLAPEHVAPLCAPDVAFAVASLALD